MHITVKLTKREWDEVLCIMGDGFDHLEMIAEDGGNDSATVRQVRSMISRGLKVDSKVRRQLTEGGAA